MPSIELGQDVLWYPDGDVNQTPHIAKVTGVGNDSLNVNIFAANSYNFIIRDGVRHIGDPRAKSTDVRSSGSWDFTPWHKEFVALKEQVAGLLNKVK